MGIMVYSLLWVVQDLYHEPYFPYSTRQPLALAHVPGASRSLEFE